MRTSFTSILIMLLASTAFAQVKPGFHLIGTVGTNNVSREQRLLINLAPEFGYFGKTIGVSVVHNTITNLYKGSKLPHHNPKAKASSVGLKLNVKLFKVDEMAIFANVEADKYIEKIDKKINGEFEYRVGGMIAVPILKNVDARISPYVLVYEQSDEWKKRYGGSFGLAYRFGH